MVGFGMVCGSEIDGIQIVFPWNVRRRLETGKGVCARLFKERVPCRPSLEMTARLGLSPRGTLPLPKGKS